MVTDNLSKAKILNAQFQSVFILVKISNFPEKGPSTQPISFNSRLSGLDVYKAAGPDNIGPIMLKKLYDIIAPILETIFNVSLKTPRLETYKCHTYI